jgi:hypothetical protein
MTTPIPMPALAPAPSPPVLGADVGVDVAVVDNAAIDTDVVAADVVAADLVDEEDVTFGLILNPRLDKTLLMKLFALPALPAGSLIRSTKFGLFDISSRLMLSFWPIVHVYRPGLSASTGGTIRIFV